MGPASKKRRLSAPDKHGRSSNQNSSGHDELFKQADGWDVEQGYEHRRRKKDESTPVYSSRLPIKTREGKIQALQGQEILGIEHDSDSSSDSSLDDSEDGKARDATNDHTGSELSIEQQIIAAKEEMARIATQIQESPEEHAGGFRALGRIADHPNPTIKKLALTTQMLVYRDAIPGYRIRPIADADMIDKASKEVKALRTYEQTMVTSYQGYLKSLNHYAGQQSRHPKHTASTSLAEVAVSCACKLLLAVPHFNFRIDLLYIIISRLAKRRRDGIFDKCLDTLHTFFQDDNEGTPALDAVTLLTKMMKQQNWHVDETVLNSFLHLRLLSEFNHKASQNRVDKDNEGDGAQGVINGKKVKVKREFRTKRQRKMLKERKEVEKEMSEANAVASHEHRDKMQAETLKLVFVTYFRILKARVPHLMGAVLEGLAKYAHLINQDFFGDILEVLKELLVESDRIEDKQEGENGDSATGVDETDYTDDLPAVHHDSTRESLLCVVTAYTLLEGQDVAKSASALHLDLTFFTSYLYAGLHDLALFPDLELSAKSLRLPDPHGSENESSQPSGLEPAKINVQTTAVLLLRALTNILTPRNIAPVRLAAFVKQLYTCALHFPEKTNLAIVALLAKIVKLQSRKVAALWNTDERRGDGNFDPWRRNLEGSNPFAATIWESELLRSHFCPSVRSGARDIEKIIRSVQ